MSTNSGLTPSRFRPAFLRQKDERSLRRRLADSGSVKDYVAVKLIGKATAIMFCPYCGAPDQKSKSYCRRCGEWLAESSSKPEQRLKVMMVFNGLNSLMALTAAIVLYSTYLNSPDAKWSIYVAGALCMVISVHQLISFIFALGLRLRSQRIRDEFKPTAFAHAEHTGQIEGGDTHPFIDMSSVTENTTEILQKAPRRVDTKPQS